jgi:hypothetical protein
MTGNVRLNGFAAAAPITDEDLVYMGQGSAGLQGEVAGTRGALAATLVFPTFADLQSAIAAGEVTLPRRVQVTADETLGGITMDYSINAAGAYFYSPMIQKVL